jgi:collagenase-like PrtC family protease
MIITRKDFHAIENLEHLISKAQSNKVSGIFPDDSYFVEEINHYRDEIRKIYAAY